MRKLVVHAEPVPAPDDRLYRPRRRAQTTLAASNGRVRLVNFWATWCAPCRNEMPALDALQRDLGGPDFEVIAIATGRNSARGHRRFRESAGITARRPRSTPRARSRPPWASPGLPVTVVLDRDGLRERARMMGGADWNGPEARALIGALTAAR